MMEEQINQTTDQLVFFLRFQKYMEDVFIVNYTITLMKIFFSKFQCGFRKSFSTQHALLPIREKINLFVITRNLTRLFSRIYQKLLTASVTISSLLN